MRVCVFPQTAPQYLILGTSLYIIFGGRSSMPLPGNQKSPCLSSGLKATHEPDPPATMASSILCLTASQSSLLNSPCITSCKSPSPETITIPVHRLHRSFSEQTKSRAWLLRRVMTTSKWTSDWVEEEILHFLVFLFLLLFGLVTGFGKY
jgi:hypothetical protein